MRGDIFLLCLSGLRISIASLEASEEHHHIRLRFLSVNEDVAALLLMHTSNAVQEVSL